MARVVNSSAVVGWMPTVSVMASYVAPIFTATPKPVNGATTTSTQGHNNNNNNYNYYYYYYSSNSGDR